MKFNDSGIVSGPGTVCPETPLHIATVPEDRRKFEATEEPCDIEKYRFEAQFPELKGEGYPDYDAFIQIYAWLSRWSRSIQLL